MAEVSELTRDGTEVAVLPVVADLVTFNSVRLRASHVRRQREIHFYQQLW